MPGRAAEIAVAIAGAVPYGGGSMAEAREVMDQVEGWKSGTQKPPLSFWLAM